MLIDEKSPGPIILPRSNENSSSWISYCKHIIEIFFLIQILDNSIVIEIINPLYALTTDKDKIERPEWPGGKHQKVRYLHMTCQIF
jgi:hypothetical protein